MKKVLVALLAVAFAAASLIAAPGEKKEKKETAAAGEKMAKEDRWSGTIQRSNKDTSTIVVRKGNVEKTVVYDSNTKWTKGKDSAEASAFKDGVRVICLGKYDEKGRLVATRIDLRAP